MREAQGAVEVHASDMPVRLRLPPFKEITMKRLKSFVVPLLIISITSALVWFFTWWWPIGYTPFVRVGGDG